MITTSEAVKEFKGVLPKGCNHVVVDVISCKLKACVSLDGLSGRDYRYVCSGDQFNECVKESNK